MPNNKPRYSLTVDGKQRTVEADKFNNNIDAFVSQMPNATVRMKDKEGNEKDIKLNDLSSAYDNGYDYVTTDKPIYVNTKAPTPTPTGGGQRVAQPTPQSAPSAQQRQQAPSATPRAQRRSVPTAAPQQQGKQEPGFFSRLWQSAKDALGLAGQSGPEGHAVSLGTAMGGRQPQAPVAQQRSAQQVNQPQQAAQQQQPTQQAAQQQPKGAQQAQPQQQNGQVSPQDAWRNQPITVGYLTKGQHETTQGAVYDQMYKEFEDYYNKLNVGDQKPSAIRYLTNRAWDYNIDEGEGGGVVVTPKGNRGGDDIDSNVTYVSDANGNVRTENTLGNGRANNIVNNVLTHFLTNKAQEAAEELAKKIPNGVNEETALDALRDNYYQSGYQKELWTIASKSGVLYKDFINDIMKPVLNETIKRTHNGLELPVNSLFSDWDYAAAAGKEYDPDALNDDERRLYDALMTDFDQRLSADRATAGQKANELAGRETASNLAIGGREGHAMQLSVPMETQREYNAYADPSKAIKYVLDKLYSNGNGGGQGGVPVKDNIDRQRVGNLLYRKIMDKLVQERIPKSKWGYVLKGFADGDLGELFKNYVQTDFERQIDNLANSKYMQSLTGFSGMLASGGHEATKFLSDAWEYYLGGKVGSAVTGAMRKRAIRRLATDLAERGIKRDVAQSIATRVFQRTAQSATRKAAMGAIHGGATMGTAQAVSGSLRQAISPAAGQKMDEILQRKAQGEQISKQQEEQEIAQANKDAHSITSVLGSGAKSGLSGIAAGMSFGPGTFAGETVSKWASKYMGDLASAATGYMARLGTNAASATALGQAEGTITGEKPEGSIANQFAQNLVNFAMLDAQGAAPRLFNGHPIKTFREWKEYERSYGISDADQQRMRDAGYGDMIDTIDGLVSERFRDRGTNTLPNSGWKPTETATRINEGMMKMFADNTIPEELKRKYYSLVTGDTSKRLSPVVASEVTTDEDGNHYLVTYNKNGNVVSDRQYHSEGAAQEAQMKIGHEQDENLTDALQQGVFAKDADALMEQAYNAAVDAFKNGDGSLSQDQQSLLYLYQNKDRLGNAIGAMNTGEPLSEADQRLVNLYYTMQNKLFEHDANSHEGNIYNIARDAETANGIQAHGLYVARKGHTEKEAKKLAEQNDEEAVHVGGDIWRTASEDAAVKDYQQRLYDYMSGIQEGEGERIREPKGLEDLSQEQPGVTVEPTQTPEPPSTEGGEVRQEPPTGEAAVAQQQPTQQTTEEPAQPQAATQQPQEAQEKSPLQQCILQGYNRGAKIDEDETQLAQIQHDADLANQRFNAAFADGKMNNFRNAIIDAVRNDDEDAMTELLNKYDGQLSEEQKEATFGLIESGAVQNGIDDNITSQTMEYQEQRQKELADISDAQGNITSLTLTDGTTAYLKNGDLTNQYGGVMVVDENGETKQIPVSSIAQAEDPVSAQQQLDDDTNAFADELKGTYQRLASGADMLPGQQANINISGQTFHVTVDRELEDGRYQLIMDDGSPIVLSPDELQQAVKAARDESVATELTNQQQQRAAQELEERRAKGIAGYAEGKPDFGAASTDPTIAGEYLRQQQAEGGHDPLSGIEGDIEEQKRLQQQAQSDLDRHQQWMDINGDQYSPEDKATKEAIIEKRKKEIADTQQRIRKLGEVRNAYMSPEQRMKLRSDRMRNSEKARKAALANRQKALEGTEPTQTTVDGIDNKTLLDNYPTQLDAENYLQARRNQITTAYRDGAARTIANVQRRLQDYYNGLEELTDDDLVQLHTDLAGAQEAERVAMERIKEIKAQQQKLGTLYKERNKAELDKMDPADRRAEILKGARTPEELLKKAHEAYKGSALEGRLDDLEPETLEEYVSQNLGYGSLNWEGTGTGISQKKGLKQELGLKRGIGHGFDSNGINAYLAPTGKGMSVDMAAHKMWEGSRGTQFDSYDDQDFKNAILDMLGSAQKATDIKYLTIRNRINEVEDYERGIEEQERWYKEQQDEELKKRQQDIDTYNDYLSSIAESSTLTPEQESYFNGLYADEIAEVEQEEADRQAAWEAYEAEKEEEQLKQNNDGSNRQGEVNSGSDMDKKPEPGTDDAGNSEGEEAVPGSPAHQPTAETEHHAQRQVGDRAAHTPAGNSDADGGVPVQGEKQGLTQRLISSGTEPSTIKHETTGTDTAVADSKRKQFDLFVRWDLEHFIGKPKDKRVTIDWEHSEPENDYIPMKIDGVPSFVGVTEQDGEDVADDAPTYESDRPVAIYDIAEGGDFPDASKTAEFETYAKDYNAENNLTEDSDDYATMDDRYPYVAFKNVDAAVKFNDWLNGRKKRIINKPKSGNGSTAVAQQQPTQQPTEKPAQEQYKPTVKLTRAGDFYEAHGDGADIAGKVLGITVTKRNDSVAKMAGFPKHALDTYLPKLIKEGYPVDIIEGGKVVEHVTPQGSIGATSTPEQMDVERQAVNTEPTDGQKEAGNYKKGHVKVDGYDITIENPKGSTRSGKDANGKEWSIKMNYDYGYILGTKGTDGDHIDVYLSDNPTSGNVYVVDQIDQKTGKFDEHKVMYGFPSMEAARDAYKSQYEDGWKVGTITEVSRPDFKKWVESSTRKTKPFSEYKSMESATMSQLTQHEGDGKNKKDISAVVNDLKQGNFDSLGSYLGDEDLGNAYRLDMDEAHDDYESQLGTTKDLTEEAVKGQISLLSKIVNQAADKVSKAEGDDLYDRLDDLARALGNRKAAQEYYDSHYSNYSRNSDPLVQAAQETGHLIIGGVPKHEEQKPTQAAEPKPLKTGDDVLAEVERRKKKKEPSAGQQLDLFGNFAEGNKTESKPTPGRKQTPAEDNNNQLKDKDNDLRGTDELRTEGLQANDHHEGEHTPRQSETTAQGREAADRKGEAESVRRVRSSDDERLRPGNELEEETPAEEPEPAPEHPLNRGNNHAERGVDYAPKGVDDRIEANIKAIELSQQITEEGRAATPDEMKVLRKYSGWGGLGKAFKEKQHPWETDGIAEQLKSLLGDEGYEQAVMSRNSAYFTPANVIDTLWDIARALGFKGGNVLEGSAGIGNIIGLMPQDMSDRSHIQAVEIDSTSGNILSLLYPEAKTDIQGFEKTKIRNGSVDLAITNVPFVTGLHVNDTTGDGDLSRKFGDIHDFCIAKNIRKLRPGGIGIFITSNGTLDKSQKLRDWIVSDGDSDVVGAFRMNNSTFGGTSATSDIIVVRRRVNGEKVPNAIDVSNIGVERVAKVKAMDRRDNYEEKPYSIDYNQYFIDHPENMGGKMYLAGEKGDTYRPTSKGLFPVPGISQTERMKEWVKKLAESAKEWKKARPARKIQGKTEEEQKVYEALGDDVHEGSMLVDSKGNLCVATYGEAVPIKVNKNKVKGHTKIECFNAYSRIKDAVKAVLDYQTKHEDNEGLEPLIKKLNQAYDSFVATYGHLNKNVAIAFLKRDMDYSSIAALETFKDSNDKNGKRVTTYGKTDIFKQRVIEKETEPKPTNIKDGVITSIYQYGKLDLNYIAEQLGKTPDEVKKEIISSGLGFEDPVTRETQVSYEYLSGNVREKLHQAEEANEDGQYNNNIQVLKKVIPMDIPSHLIDFTLGSSWLDSTLYDEYIKDRTGIDVTTSNVNGTWAANVPKYGLNTEKNRTFGVHSSLFNTDVYGTDLIIAAMKNKTIGVSRVEKHADGKSETVTDKDATTMCAQRIEEIRDDFKDWARGKMQNDPDLAKKYEDRYNEQFNNYVPREIPDNFLPEYFAGANHAIHLRAHQAKAAIRATMQNVLFAHEVGSGKTFTLITTAMEMRRLGTAKKPLIVVQNATVGQFVASAKFLYPNAKILTIDDKEHDEQGRRAFYAKVKYNDWDMIVIPQSVLEKIPDSDERQLKFIQDKVAEKEAVLAQMQNSDMDDPFVTRRAEKELADLQDQMQEITQHMNEHKKERDSKKAAVARQNAAVKAQEMLNRKVDDVENFDDMGIDAFLVDEAHEYKHLGFATAMQRGVKGIDPSYSKKCAGVYLKCQSVMEKSGGKNVVFATGTPISNTAAEIWTFMKYLMPEDRMKSYGIYYFDDFVRNFGTLSQMPEFNTSGQFVEVNRFRGYSNLPELVRIWSGVADTVLSSEVGDLSAKIPKMKSGKAIDVYLPQSRSLRAVMKYVREQLKKFNEMSGKEKRANSAIPLKMYNIAKQAAVDPRLVSSNSPDEPNSKTNAAVKETLKSLDESKTYRGTIAIFADNYQNSDGKFNLFDDIKKKLVAKGVPENEIVIIRPSMKVNKKTEIFDKLNAGEVRVVMGTTFTLGTGANFQERLYTLINIDAPNRPMDYTQRLGRILRQGNLHREWGIPVKVIRFGVEDSLDVTAYQRLKTKGAIADSIMHGKQLMKNSMENRTIEEEEDQFGDTVAQLSGSQYAMLKQGAEREVKKWENKKKQWEADQVYIHAAKPRLKGQIEEAQKRADYNAKGLQYLEEHKGDGTIIAGKQRFKNVEAMGDFIKNFNKTVKANEDEMRKSRDQSPRAISVNLSIDGVNFKITMKLDRDMMSNGRTLFEKISRDMRYYCPQLTGDWGVPVKGDLLRNALEDITQNVMTGNDLRERKKSAENEVTRLKGELEQVVSREGKPFQYGDKLADAQKKLADFTEKMKAELEEKQKKYAAIDAEVEEVTPDDVNTDGGDTEQSEDGDKGTLYRMADDDEAAMLDKEPTVKVYRAMQLIDGKLYPPMMAAVKGKLVEPRELGQWEVADERPDIITHTKMNKKGEEIGYVKLDKGSKTSLGKRGTPIPAAYNPYWHTSRSPLNDQFKSAWIRPNIVTVEVEIPESELTSGYRAKYAKDPVGETDWLSGVVTKQLTAQGHAPRKVILSRYDKPVRVLSAAETAERIIDYIGDYDVTIPENVVTPQVRVELEKRGIKIGEPEKGVKKTEQIREAIERGLSVSDDMLRDSEVFEDGEKMPIYVREGNYGVEGLNNDYRTISDLLDAFRDKYPSYVATIVDNSGKEIDPYGDNRYILDHWIDGINIQVEPWKKYLKGGEAVAKQQPTQQGIEKEAYIARKTRNAQTAVKHWADKLHLGDKVTVLTSTDGLQGNKARAKGWYVPKDDKITIVLPNHTNVGDVIRTLLHEGVAHYGLRKLFGKHFDTFLDNVYNNANYDVKSRIRRLEEKYNGDKRKATEEYLAGLSEDTDFEHTVNSSWWGRIKNLFLDMLAKVGLKLRHALTDSDLRYVLWRSYENMKRPGEKRTPGDGHLDDPIKEIEGEKEPEKAVEKPKAVRHEPVVPKPRVAAEKQDIASKIKEIKAAHGNPLVLINGGGYFSAYGKDAETLAKLFGTELIRQGGKKDGLALTSVMSDDLDSVLPRLIRAGHRVAVADERDIFAGEPGNDEAIVFDKDDIYSGDSMNRRGAATREHTEQEKEDMRNAAEELGETLGGVTVTMEHNGKDGIKGSYNTGDDTVHVNLDEADGIEDIEATVAHEVLGHEGLKALFASNKGVDKFGQFIYDSASKKLRRAIVEKAAEEGYEWTDPQRFSKAAQEVFSDIASDGPANADEFSLWRKVKHYVIRALKALGIRIRGLVNDHDLRYYVLKTGKAVKKWRTMDAEAQQEAAEPGRIMYSRRGKPRKKKDETMAQYINRLRNYEQWKQAEEKAKAANDPLPEKADYDQKAQDEYNKAMDDWRKANNINPGDAEPNEFPKRNDGESPQDYAIRVADYETQSDIWKNAPNVFDYMKKAQDEYHAAYEAWKTRYDLQEMENVDERLYSGEPIPGAKPQTEEQHYDQLEVEHAVERDAERELGDAVGMDLSADGARHHAKLAVIERRKNLESASAEDAIFIHGLCKDIDALAKKKGMKPAELREKLIDVIESPVAQQEAEKEVDKWVEVLNNMRAFQDAHAAITADGVEAAMPELNALSHLYVKYGVKPSTYEQRKEIHDAAKALADKFNDYYKDTTGYNQLFGDDIMQVGKYIVKMSDAAYAAAEASKLGEDPEVKAIVDRIHDWYDNFFHAIEDAGLRGDAGYVENGYINHIWDKEKSDPSAWEKYVENFQRTKSANMRHRTISTYADGIEVGLVPKFNDVAKIMSYYSRQNNEAIANKKFLDDLSFLTVSELNQDGEEVRTLPVLNSHHPNRFDEERYQMYHVPGVGDVWVLKDVARRFSSIFGTMRTQDIPDWLTKTGKVYDLLGSTMKKIQLSISGFHMGALSEVALAQMRPDRGMKAIFKYILLDSIRNHGEIPAYAHPEDFKLAAQHLVQLGATQDYAAADVNMITEKFRNYVKGLRKDDAFIKQAAGGALTPLAVALDMINKGMDKLLWNYLHDGLKIACFKQFAEQIDRRVEKEGLTAEQRERLLDEAGQYVNDTFGGQYWELLNVSPAALKWMRRALLSPDWFISTQRHFFANFGFGSLYDTRSFGEYVKESLRLKRAAAQQRPTGPSAAEAIEDDGDIYRKFRSKEARLCYVLGVCVFFYTMMNGINAVMRARDKEKEQEKADEIRKTNPDYKSPYELAYPDGMKWYDYTMLGNSLGQQTHLFLGRYEDGTEMYVRWGKQFREFPEMFIGRKGLDFPAPMIQRLMGKANPVIGLMRDNLGALGIWGFENQNDIADIQAKYGKTIGLLAMNARHFIPYSLPSQADKEGKFIDFFMPSSKGFTQYKTVDYFKDFIKAGDMEGVARTYKAATMNGVDAEKCLKAAISTLQAEQRSELSDGIDDLDKAVKRYDAATTLQEKKVLKNKLTKLLAAQGYKAFTRDEALQMIEDYQNGDNVAEKDNDRYIELSNSDDIRADYRLSAISKQAKKYVTQIKTAQTNCDAATAEKLANRYGAWIEINGIINQERSAVNKLKKELGKGNDKAVMKEIREIRKQAQQLVDDVPAPK